MGIRYIDQVKIKNKKVITRVDFNISLTQNRLSIADDARIKQTLPTLQYLLKSNNKLILISHLSRPKKRNKKYSLAIVAKHLNKLIPKHKVIFVDNFLNVDGQDLIEKQKENEIIFLENIRFYPEERHNDNEFSKKIAALGDVFVNDAFGVMHRTQASIVGIAQYLPSYGGLLLKKEIESISKIIKKPKRPFVAIIGGAKVSTKIHILEKLCKIADYLLVGGGLANTLLYAQGHNIGHSRYDYEELEKAKKLLAHIKKSKIKVMLPVDVVIGHPNDQEEAGEVREVENIPMNKYVLDIGPDTQAQFGNIINRARTIVWNGPMGYFENIIYRKGTDFIYYSIAYNNKAYSIVGGGDTLAAISKKEYIDRITHLSTGGGALLEFIEKGTLPGIEALK